MQKKKKEGHEQDARGHGILTLQKIKEKKRRNEYRKHKMTKQRESWEMKRGKVAFGWTPRCFQQ